MPLASLDATQVAILVGVGFGAGVLGGLLGIGGGLVMIPAMLLILGEELYGDNSFHLYKLAAIATATAVSIPAAVRHIRAGTLVRAMLMGIVPLGLLGVLAGVGAAALFTDDQTQILRRMFGGFVLVAVGFNLYLRRGNTPSEHVTRDRCPVATRRGLFGSFVGIPAGVIAGLLGVGGGVWAVPAQHLGLGIRLRHAISNSSGMIVFLAPATALVLSLSIARMGGVHVGDGWLLAGCLTPGALLGGWCGAGLIHRLPLRWIRLAFHLLLVVTGLRLLLA